MKKTAFILTACALLSACTSNHPMQACPSCDPPVRHFEVVTECSEYQDTSLGKNRFAQCRYCTNKIYSNGVDVTAQFMGSDKPASTKHKVPCKQK